MYVQAGPTDVHELLHGRPDHLLRHPAVPDLSSVRPDRSYTARELEDVRCGRCVGGDTAHSRRCSNDYSQNKTIIQFQQFQSSGLLIAACTLIVCLAFGLSVTSSLQRDKLNHVILAHIQGVSKSSPP